MSEPTKPSPDAVAAQVFRALAIYGYEGEPEPAIKLIATALTQAQIETLQNVALQLVKENDSYDNNGWAQAERNWSVLFTEQANALRRRQGGEGIS